MTRRLLVSYLLLAAFVLVVVELPLGLTYAARQRDRLLADVERDARVMAGLVEERVEADDVAAVRTITERYARQTTGRVVVTDGNGVSLVDTSRAGAGPRDFSTRPEFRVALDGAQATGVRRSETLDEELAYATVPITSGSEVTGAVRVSFPTDTVRRQVRDNWLRLGLLSALVLAGAASLGWLVSRWAVRPVAELEEGARRLAAGDLSARAEVDRGPPELRDLADTFNDMAARLQHLVGSQRAFVADASHQLRTPLTALRLRIESLEDELDDDPAAAQRDLEAVGAEVERLSDLVEALLALARAEGSAATPRPLDATATVREATERWEALAQEHGVTIRTAARHTAIQVLAVPGALEQVLDNLLDNAIEVAPPGTAVEVDLGPGPEDGTVVVQVRDHGPGMSAAERDRALDRFWRGPSAPPGGTGLGLAIVAELVDACGGSVHLDAPASGSGLVVEVRLRPA